MREYPKRVKRLVRDYAALAYEAELGSALRELESQFANWRGGEISARELNDRIYAFTRGPARELLGRFDGRSDDIQVAHAIVTGLLPRDTIPAELLDALLPIIAVYEREQAEADAE